MTPRLVGVVCWAFVLSAVMGASPFGPNPGLVLAEKRVFLATPERGTLVAGPLVTVVAALWVDEKMQGRRKTILPCAFYGAEYGIGGTRLILETLLFASIPTYTYLGVLLVGLCALIWSVDHYLQWKERSQWPTVTATITGGTTVIIGQGQNRVFAPRVALTYSYMDQEYALPHVRFNDDEFEDPLTATQQATEKATIGTMVVHINPKHPQQVQHEVVLPAAFKPVLLGGLLLTALATLALSLI